MCSVVVGGKSCFNEVWLLIRPWCLLVESGISASVEGTLIGIIERDENGRFMY